jgi:pimeloyl-ACP methyl ester carboxylesterase
MTTRRILHTDPATARANGIEIVYDTFGEASAPALLLVGGLGQQMIGWEEEFCAQLAERGYRVIRFDNRDVGLSTHFDEAGVPDILAAMQGQAIQAPYTLRDMADDAVGLLDALDIESAHVVGASMGGMISQVMAIDHPQRVSTLTSIMSTTGDPSLPPPTPEAAAILVTPAPVDRAGSLDHAVRVWQVLNGPGFPLDEALVREQAGRAFDRAPGSMGVARQLVAILTSGSRRETLKSVAIPTLVIHGDGDPLVPLAAGIDTANSIPGAELLVIEGMGHELPRLAWPQIVDAIARHAV